MRLRRETGDFSIAFTEEVTSKTIVTGLGVEDLIGVIIDVDGTYYAVTSASESEGVITLGIGTDDTVTYTVATGVVEFEAADDGND